MGALYLAVLLAAAWAALAMAAMHRQTKAYGARALFAKPAGDAGAGVRYAFTQGMAPWAKESVMLNLPAYGAGLAFHGGVLAALLLLPVAASGVVLPPALLLLARLATLAGAAGGAGLLLKRLLTAHLRGLSAPDDFLSNLLATAFPLLALVWTFRPAAQGAWMVETTLLLVYAPLGKIRHCLFFFASRRQMGAFFGRRGVFPTERSLHG